MKYFLGLFFVVALVALQTINAVKVCVIRVNNCGTTNVCGRMGGSNLCQKFENNCGLEAANCEDGPGYTAVNSSLCTNIALNQRRTCGGSSTSSSSGGFSGGLWSKLLGGSSSKPIVTPIIITRNG
ncbi:uncharacterized protein LOC142229957 [Haematobia irritans]|uniref:uncharacterized protein LOC142229957 n=1 Tax=Haematobia irritans TaxID=7368 RepID=UPI003F508D39